MGDWKMFASQWKPALAALLLTAVAAPEPASAGEAAAAVNTGYFGNVAIEGYDTVAYFRESRAVKGDPAISHTWFGAEWHFSSAENRDLFAGDPIRYAPQYGGMCADGVAYGDITVNIDPHAFSIIDGMLYLNFDPGAKEELETVPGQVERADANWPAVQKRFQGN